MGKGGQNVADVVIKESPIQKDLVKVYPMKLNHLNTEDLKKWAKAYGQDSEADRDVLLASLNPLADGILDTDRPANLPLERPTFTLKDIRDAIPAHCFQRNLYTSLLHLASDLAAVFTLGYCASLIDQPYMPVWSPYILWPLYWYAQGAVFTGVWVLAHECGHQSFSESELANNFFGTILHSLLLVPYHSWRITHGKHHNNTGSCENDEVFAPSTRADWIADQMRETPFAQGWGLFIMLTVGWIPGYLVLNMTGPKKYRGQNVNHFSPTAVFFKPEEYFLIVQTNLALVVVLAAMAYCSATFGFATVASYYLIPYIIANYHLVLITYLQHTDVFTPHFRGAEWSWLRGALCTIDRSFGPVLDHTFHHISDTHVCHHLFSKMPFHHAQEATEHIRKMLGPYYMKDETALMRALYRSYSSCQFVEDDGETVFYKNIK